MNTIRDLNRKVADQDQNNIVDLRKDIVDIQKYAADLQKNVADQDQKLKDLHQKTSPFSNKYENLRMYELRQPFFGPREIDRVSLNEIAHGGSIVFDVNMIDRYRDFLSDKDCAILDIGFAQTYDVAYHEFKMHYQDTFAPDKITDTLDKRANLKCLHWNKFPALKYDLQVLCNEIITTWTQTFDYNENLATLCHDLKMKYEKAFMELVTLA